MCMLCSFFSFSCCLEEEELNEGEKEEELTPREKRIRAREAKKMNVDKE